MTLFSKLFGKKPVASSDGTKQRRRVLVAGSGLTTGKVVELALRDVVVTTTKTIEETKASLSTDRPDLVIAFLTYPDGDGYQLCKMVTTDPFHPCPVILLRAPWDDFDGDKAQVAGASAVLTIPFEPNDLIAAVQRTLEQR